MARLRVLAAVTPTLLRDLTREVIEREATIELVADAADLDELLAVARRSAFDVVVISREDTSIPPPLAQVLAERPEARVVVVVGGREVAAYERSGPVEVLELSDESLLRAIRGGPGPRG